MLSALVIYAVCSFRWKVALDVQVGIDRRISWLIPKAHIALEQVQTYEFVVVKPYSVVDTECN